MGITDWWKRNFGSSDTTGDKYVLKRQGPKGGMHKVMELAEPTPIDDIFESLDAGIYALHKYSKGQTGFSVEWGPIEVTGAPGDEKPETRAKGGGGAMSEFAQVARGLAALKDEAQAEFNIIAPLFGIQIGEGGPKSFVEQYREAKAEFQELSGLFGSTTGGLEAIKYEGTVPIWLHPQLIPELVDTTMDKLEKRLTRWGLVEDDESVARREDDEALPTFPEKPKEKPQLETDVVDEAVALNPDEFEEPEAGESEKEEPEAEEEEKEDEEA